MHCPAVSLYHRRPSPIKRDTTNSIRRSGMSSVRLFREALVHHREVSALIPAPDARVVKGRRNTRLDLCDHTLPFDDSSSLSALTTSYCVNSKPHRLWQRKERVSARHGQCAHHSKRRYISQYPLVFKRISISALCWSNRGKLTILHIIYVSIIGGLP